MDWIDRFGLSWFFCGFLILLVVIGGIMFLMSIAAFFV